MWTRSGRQEDVDEVLFVVHDDRWPRWENGGGSGNSSRAGYTERSAVMRQLCQGPAAIVEFGQQRRVCFDRMRHRQSNEHWGSSKRGKRDARMNFARVCVWGG
jgi:hypothetical protein